MKHRLPRTENAPVLAGVKATPFGWPAASLDPDSGRGPQAASGAPLHESSKTGLYGFRGLPDTPSVWVAGPS
jgi:hypothetical protein